MAITILMLSSIMVCEPPVPWPAQCHQWFVSAGVPKETQQKKPDAPQRSERIDRLFLSRGLLEIEQALKEAQGARLADQGAFGLGMLQFLRAVEGMTQQLYKHGLGNTASLAAGQLPLLRLPVPPHPAPERLTPALARQAIEKFLLDLERAEATLARVSDPNVKVPVTFGTLRIDINADGKYDQDEQFWKLYAAINRGANLTEEHAKTFVIAFDRADVHWLRGYCHLLMAFCEFVLAHDMHELFLTSAHLVFPNVDTPFARDASLQNFDQRAIADLIAGLHLIRFPVKEAERMPKALAHLESMLAQSRESWKWLEQESDDDREWIPNPKQTGVIPNVRITNEMVASWKEFLDEMSLVLAGKKLVPHWRLPSGRGVNLRKVFTEPRPFDLVLWMQGTAALPYLEQGDLTGMHIVQRMQRVFQGEFFGFALWFN